MLVKKAALSAFLYFFSFLKAPSFEPSFAYSVCFYLSTEATAVSSFSSSFFFSSSIYRSFCSIFFYFDCIRIFSFVF
jgi:hypothetical protein